MGMQVVCFQVSGPVLLIPNRHGDARGYFSETFRQDFFDEAVRPLSFVQDNESMSAEPGTVRGLHFQLNPKAQGKLVRCIGGALIDVAVDIRQGSPTYGQHVKAELSAENGQQLWIPPGFAHGFCTLAPNTVVTYKVTEYYSPQHDRGLRWNDPALGIDWPVSEEKAVLSVKDSAQPFLSQLDAGFFYTG